MQPYEVWKLGIDVVIYNQLNSFIAEKWSYFNNLSKQNNLACFNRIILYCYFVVRTVRVGAINRLVSKKVV